MANPVWSFQPHIVILSEAKNLLHHAPAHAAPKSRLFALLRVTEPIIAEKSSAMGASESLLHPVFISEKPVIPDISHRESRSSFQTNFSTAGQFIGVDVLIPSSSGLHFKLLCEKSSFFTTAYKGGCRKSSGVREEPDTDPVVVHGVLNQWKKN